MVEQYWSTLRETYEPCLEGSLSYKNFILWWMWTNNLSYTWRTIEVLYVFLHGEFCWSWFILWWGKIVWTKNANARWNDLIKGFSKRTNKRINLSNLLSFFINESCCPTHTITNRFWCKSPQSWLRWNLRFHPHDLLYNKS